ncbi:MAG: polysaccharide deacetylase family protein, partial [Desulfatirhabdiaceae bacterium]
VITFDDGYRDNYTIVYPILKSLEIPAFFFVCTSMVDDRCLGGWDILAYLLKKCEKPCITLNGKTYDLRSNRQHSLELIQTDMKAMPCGQSNEFIRSISNICEVEFPSVDLQDKELLTWKNIKDMTSHHMTIGSHTHTHSVLTGMAFDQHLKELLTSKQILEKRTGRPILSMAYPFGDPLYIPDTIQKTAMMCGYRLGFTSDFGINRLNGARPLALNRIAGHLDMEYTAAVMTVLPHLFTRNQISSHDINTV